MEVEEVAGSALIRCPINQLTVAVWSKDEPGVWGASISNSISISEAQDPNLWF